MPQTDQRRRLIDLFRETGPAHHRAYSAANGADPEWPLWYADFFIDRYGAMAGQMPEAPRM